MKAKYLIEIERVKDPGDFEGNDIPAELAPMTALQLQRAIAYDLVRVRSADPMPFQSITGGYAPPTHRPEFG